MVYWVDFVNYGGWIICDWVEGDIFEVVRDAEWVVWFDFIDLKQDSLTCDFLHEVLW